MADDNESSYGPYKDEGLQYSDLISNLINPSAATPAGPSPAPAPAAAAPVAPAPTPSPSPSAVTRSGDPSQPAAPSKWADLVRSGQVKLGQDQGELQRLQQTGPGVNQIKNGFGRGVAKVADAIGTAVAPGLAARLPGTTMHNRELQAIEQGRIKQDEDSLKSTQGGADTEAQMQERGARAAKENAQAQAFTPVTLSPEQAASIGHPELTGESLDQRAYSAMLTTVQKGKDAQSRTDSNNQTKTGIATQNNQTKTDIAGQNNQTKTDIANNRNKTAEDVARIRHAARTTLGGNTPEREQQRQAIINDSTAKVNKLNTYEFDQDANDGRGGFYDPKNPNAIYSPEEFTAMKNQIAADMDKQLTAKKFNALGVKFDVNATTPGRGAQPAAQPAQPAKAAPAKQQAAIQAGNGQALTDAGLAKQYLAKAGGDKDKARQLAKTDGWKF